MKHIKKASVIIAVVIITMIITYRVTMHNISIRVTDDTAYITAFGQTDEYDYYPDF